MHQLFPPPGGTVSCMRPVRCVCCMLCCVCRRLRPRVWGSSVSCGVTGTVNNPQMPPRTNQLSTMTLTDSPHQIRGPRPLHQGMHTYTYKCGALPLLAEGLIALACDQCLLHVTMCVTCHYASCILLAGGACCMSTSPTCPPALMTLIRPLTHMRVRKMSLTHTDSPQAAGCRGGSCTHRTRSLMRTVMVRHTHT